MLGRSRIAFVGIMVFLFLLSGFIVVRAGTNSESFLFLPLLNRPLPYPLWVMTIGGSEYDAATAIAEIGTGDLIVVGHTSSAPYSGLMVRLRPEGTILDLNTYPGVTFANASRTVDGGLIAVGTEETGTGRNGLVLRFGADGGLIWARSFEDTYRIFDAAQTEDEGFLVAGYRGFVGPWIFRLDSNGSVVWQRQYGGSDGTIFESIDSTGDGGAIVAGETEDKAFAMKLNPDGTIAWQRYYDGWSDYDDFFMAALETEDGGYIAAGYRWPDGWIVKLHSDGLVDWQYSYEYPSTGAFESISPTGSSSFIVAGGTGISGNLLRVEADGSVEWIKNYVGGSFESAIEVGSGGYAAAGLMYDDLNDRQVFAVRADEFGSVHDCDMLETPVGGTVVKSIIVGETNRPSTPSSFASLFVQPTAFSTSLDTSILCPLVPEGHFGEIAVEPGC